MEFERLSAQTPAISRETVNVNSVFRGCMFGSKRLAVVMLPSLLLEIRSDGKQTLTVDRTVAPNGAGPMPLVQYDCKSPVPQGRHNLPTIF